jgi:hypothetical protein
MPDQITKNEIEETILTVADDPGLRAMALFGEWGTGKTYLVRKLFQKHLTWDRLKPLKLQFAYVSLFGINSVAEVRKRICVGSLRGQGKGLLKAADKVKKTLPKALTVYGIGLDLSNMGDLASDLIEDKAIANLFVCIDDLERAGSELSIHDVLGLIAELTEVRECKCLVLFNREKLTDDRRKELDAQDEKIFDLSVEFRPTPKDNLAIGFHDSNDRELARSAFVEFQNANIRIMNRVGWLLRQMRKANAAHLKDLWSDLVQHASILTILRHAHSDTVPDLFEAIRGPNLMLRIFGDKDAESKIPRQITERLDALSFSVRPFDEPLINALLNGFLAADKFNASVEDAYDAGLSTRNAAEAKEFISLLHRGFGTKAADYLTRLKRFLSDHGSDIDRPLLAELCEILLTLEVTDETRRLVEAVLAPILRPIAAADRANELKSFPAIHRIGIHESIPYEPIVRRPAIEKVFEKLAASPSGWDPAEFKHLVQFDDTEIRKHLLTLQSNDATFQIQRLLERISHDVEPGLAGDLRKRLLAILEGIATMDPLYRYQIESVILASARKG